MHGKYRNSPQKFTVISWFKSTVYDISWHDKPQSTSEVVLKTVIKTLPIVNSTDLSWVLLTGRDYKTSYSMTCYITFWEVSNKMKKMQTLNMSHRVEWLYRICIRHNIHTRNWLVITRTLSNISTISFCLNLHRWSTCDNTISSVHFLLHQISLKIANTDCY